MKNPLIMFTGAALATLAALAGLKMTDWPADAPKASNATEAVSEEPKAAGAEAEKPADKPAEVAAVQPTDTPKAETPAETPAPAPETAAAPAKPELDTVRVEADGQAIVAGRAQPGAEVSLKLGDLTLGKGVANADGAWVVVPDNPLPKGAHELTVEQKGADGSSSLSEKSIAVAVPEAAGQQAMVALTEPGAATKVLQAGGSTEQVAAAETPAQPAQAEKPAEPEQQTAAAEPAPQPQTGEAPAAVTPAEQPPAEQPAAETAEKTAEAPAATEQPADNGGAVQPQSKSQETAALEAEPAAPAQTAQPAETAAPKATETPAKTAAVPLRLDAVDYNDKGDIIFSGRAQPGTAVRLYVDNGAVGDAIVDSQGNWSFAGSDIIKPGTHALRADQIDSGGKVVARIELPFQREDAAAVAALNAPPEPQPAPEPQVAEAQPTPRPAAPEKSEQLPAPAPQTTEVAKAEPDQTVTQPAPQTTEVAKAEPEAAAPVSEQPTAQAPAAETSEQANAEPTAAAPETQQPDKPRSGKVVIQPGNNLWKLSRVIYGRGINFTVIYDANKEQIRNPDLIYPGQIFAIPNATPPESIDPKRRDPLTSAEGGAAQ